MVCLLAVAGVGGASFVPDRSSCATAGRDATCQFTCALGDVLIVFVQGSNVFVETQANAQCGGAVAQCHAFTGCAGTSLTTTVPGIGQCSTFASQAATLCASVPNPRGVVLAGYPSCSVTAEAQSCYYACALGQQLVVSAIGPYSFAPASVMTTCGGQTASCSGTGTCTGSSPGRTTQPIGLGTCRPYSATSQVTCSVK